MCIFFGLIDRNLQLLRVPLCPTPSADENTDVLRLVTMSSNRMLETDDLLDAIWKMLMMISPG
jgi:hypothetical protein